MTVTHYLIQSFYALLLFLVGFVVGSILDVIFFAIYKRIDPKEQNNTKLFILIVIQLYILILIFSITYNNILKITSPLLLYFIRIGLLTSQLFLMEYAMERLADIIYNRKKNTGLIQRMPILGSFISGS